MLHMCRVYCVLLRPDIEVLLAGPYKHVAMACASSPHSLDNQQVNASYVQGLLCVAAA